MKDRLLILKGEPIAQNLIAALSAAFTVINEDDLKASEVKTIKYVWVYLSTVVDQRFLNKFPELRAVILTATGHTTVDTKMLDERKIQLISLKGHREFLETISSSSEHAWSLLLAGNSKLMKSYLQVKSGSWDKTMVSKNEIQGKVLGIIGMGRIGKKLAQYGLAFKMQIIWYDPHVGEKIELNLYRTVDLKELLQKADHIILAASVLGTPRQILGPNEISEIKVGSGLVNISRGSLVDERAILRALNQRKLDYFAADVLQEEDFQYLENRPTSLRKELVAHENVIITPHIGGYSKDARERCDHHLATYLLEKGCKCDLLAGLRQI